MGDSILVRGGKDKFLILSGDGDDLEALMYYNDARDFEYERGEWEVVVPDLDARMFEHYYDDIFAFETRKTCLKRGYFSFDVFEATECCTGRANDAPEAMQRFFSDLWEKAEWMRLPEKE
jgi:hypothetical protein